MRWGEAHGWAGNIARGTRSTHRRHPVTSCSVEPWPTRRRGGASVCRWQRASTKHPRRCESTAGGGWGCKPGTDRSGTAMTYPQECRHGSGRDGRSRVEAHGVRAGRARPGGGAVGCGRPERKVAGRRWSGETAAETARVAPTGAQHARGRRGGGGRQEWTAKACEVRTHVRHGWSDSARRARQSRKARGGHRGGRPIWGSYRVVLPRRQLRSVRRHVGGAGEKAESLEHRRQQRVKPGAQRSRRGSARSVSHVRSDNIVAPSSASRWTGQRHKRNAGRPVGRQEAVTDERREENARREVGLRARLKGRRAVLRGPSSRLSARGASRRTGATGVRCASCWSWSA